PPLSFCGQPFVETAVPVRAGVLRSAALHFRSAPKRGNVAKRYWLFGGLVGLACATAAAAAEEPILVTATRAPEPEITTPVADTIITGEEARERGATDLRSALAPAAGVEVLPGSDTGPGGSVVALQGLTEMDAYLLVVDGVPYGGAFNPA